jgi:mannose-6-phosphate isomerase-like protein (cupin superfamily)
MVRHALEHPDFATISNWMLAKRDAHGVYASLGFQPIADPASRPADWMICRRVKPAWTRPAPTEKGAALRNSINLAEKFAQITEHWRPEVAAELNGQELKLVKFSGVFPWHHHEKEDELFLVWRGRMKIEFRDRLVELGEGELCVVPHGIEHRTLAESEAEVLIFEPAAAPNTGNGLDERFTAPNGVRVQASGNSL